jgi:stage II sporulation protein D
MSKNRSLFSAGGNKIIYSLLLYFIFVFTSSAEPIRIRVLSHLKLGSLFFSPDKGAYKVTADGKDVFALEANGVLKISIVGDSIELKSVEHFIGKFCTVKITGQTGDDAFRIKCVIPDRKFRFYQDDLTIVSDPETKTLRVINVIELDKYISGVVEAEAGSRSAPEFYKVQAILARTYALSIVGKHTTEGHDLCDQVHCQAFYGRTKEVEILKAVFATKGLVVVDHDMNLINAVFHSNSGGQTANAEDVWNKPLPYLKSVNDTFSYNMPNYKWSRKMAVEDWLSYLKIKHNFPVEDSLARNAALNFIQEKRKSYLEVKGVKVPLKNVRTDLALKSTFFSIQTNNDSIIFYGRGYGHGIGMCQEGAMKMTRMGFKYPEVIKFYYRNVHLIDKTQLGFFKED